MNCDIQNYDETAVSQKPVETGTINAIKNWWKIRAEQRINRAAFQHLISLDDDMLKDIGVTRDDVNWASRLPTDQNASLELQRVAAMRNRRIL